MRKILIIGVLLAGCGEDRNMYEAGYSDGQAVGYNTTCKIRSTLVEGAWEDKEYKRGYDEGYAQGAYECRTGVKY